MDAAMLKKLKEATIYVYAPTADTVGKTFTITAHKSGRVRTNVLPDNKYLYVTVDGGEEYTITCESYTTTVVIGYGEIAKVNIGINKTTWAGIKRMVDAGIESSYLHPGDNYSVALSTGETVVFEVMGVDTYAGCVDFIAKDLILTMKQQHTTDTNAGGWDGSDLKKWLNETFYTYLPDDLKAVITARDIKASAGSQSSSILSTSCKIWLPAEYELFGKTTYAATTEAANLKQYPIFTDNTSRVKHLGPTGAATWYWQVSPNVGTSTYFCYVYTDGSATTAAASAAEGVAPCFRIQKSAA